MKELTVTTTATVISEETWVVTVPDDFDETDENAIEELFTDGGYDMNLESEDPQATLERSINSVKVVSVHA